MATVKMAITAIEVEVDGQKVFLKDTFELAKHVNKYHDVRAIVTWSDGKRKIRHSLVLWAPLAYDCMDAILHDTILNDYCKTNNPLLRTILVNGAMG